MFHGSSISNLILPVSCHSSTDVTTVTIFWLTNVSLSIYGNNKSGVKWDYSYEMFQKYKKHCDHLAIGHGGNTLNIVSKDIKHEIDDLTRLLQSLSLASNFWKSQNF